MGNLSLCAVVPRDFCGGNGGKERRENKKGGEGVQEKQFNREYSDVIYILATQGCRRNCCSPPGKTA